jgi:hypothetical protein
MTWSYVQDLYAPTGAFSDSPPFGLVAPVSESLVGTRTLRANSNFPTFELELELLQSKPFLGRLNLQ